MKKSAIYLIVLLSLALILVACDSGDNTVDPAQSPPAEEVVEEAAVDPEPTAETEPVEESVPEMEADELAEEQVAATDENTPQKSAAAYEPTLLPSPCYFMMPEGLSNEDVICGMAEMPMNRDEPEGAKVRLPYVIVKSTNPEPRPDPFLYLVGGPGGSIVNRLTEQYHEWDPFRAEHDLIFYNPRGTVLAEPYIDCQQYIGGLDFEQERAALEEQMPEAWLPLREDTLSLPACLDIYREKGVDFTQYNSLANAQDAADLMQALGYDEYNLYGLSYGTRLALSIMRDRPEQVRAVILDSNFPPNLDTMINTASIGYEAGLQLFKQCAADVACNETFPDLKTRFEELATRLAEEPMVLNDEYVQEINEFELISFLMNAGPNPQSMAYVPLVIDQLYNGNSDVYLRLIKRELPPLEEGLEPVIIPAPDRDFDYATMSELSNDYGMAVYALAEGDREQYVQTRYEFVKQIMQGSSRKELMTFTANFPEETAADLQQRMEALSDDGVETMLSLLHFDFLTHIDTSDLVNLLVNCYDDYNFTTYVEGTAPNVYGLPDELLESDRESNRDALAKCSLLPTGRGPDWMIEPVSSDIPVLIFQGLADNNTPPSWSAIERPTLANHFYVEVPAAPHGVIQMGECVTDIAQDFLNDPDQEPDSSCVEQFRPEFVTEVPAAEGTPQQAASSTVRTEERPCNLFIPEDEAAGETIHCGYVVVPAERDNPDSEEVKLATVTLEATGDGPVADPIIHVSGGPGISATSRTTIVELAKRYAPFRKTRDIILFDQRGIGNSLPKFTCDNLAEANSAEDEELSEADSISRCQERLRNQGYPAEAFATAVSAADLVDIMRALGYPAYNLYGISYGSRLLMSLMHHFPNEPLLRTVVLDSVDTLPEDYGTEYRSETHLLQQALFESIFDECAADPDCVAAYPNLRARFSALVEQLDHNPLVLDEFSTIDGDMLTSLMFPFNSELQNIPYHPRLIAEMENGITETLDLVRLGNIPAPATHTSFLPPEPPAGQELRDLYNACTIESVSQGDAESARLIGLWDAGTDDVASYLNEVCAPETAAAAVAIVEQHPRIFNYIIDRWVPNDTQDFNSEMNRKLGCTEMVPFREDLNSLEAHLRDAHMPVFYIEQTMVELNARAEDCESWDSALAAPTPERYGEYPTLILNGQFDALTPPTWAETAAAAVPQSQYVPIPNAGHSIMGNNGDCPTGITNQFLANPDGAVDTSCTEEMKIKFIVP